MGIYYSTQYCDVCKEETTWCFISVGPMSNNCLKCQDKKNKEMMESKNDRKTTTY